MSLDSLGRIQEAADLSKEVMKLRIEVSGRQHPDTLQAIGNYANLSDLAQAR